MHISFSIAVTPLLAAQIVYASPNNGIDTAVSATRTSFIFVNPPAITVPAKNADPIPAKQSIASSKFSTSMVSAVATVTPAPAVYRKPAYPPLPSNIPQLPYSISNENPAEKLSSENLYFLKPWRPLPTYPTSSSALFYGKQCQKPRFGSTTCRYLEECNAGVLCSRIRMRRD